MPAVDTPRGHLYFADHRKENSGRTPVVFIHGAGDTHLVWPRELRRLPEANPILPDLPGHGKSSGLGRDTIEDYAADIVALLDALHVSQAIIAGQSMGGAIAQMMALTSPDRVAGLILMSTGAKLSVHPDILDRARTQPQAVANLLKDWLWGETATDVQREGTYRQIMAMPPEVVYGDYAACNGFDVRARLGEIHAPTLIISGTADRLTPHKYGVYLQQHIPGAKLVTMEGAGHMLTLEEPQVVAEAIRNWLEEVKS